MKAWNRAKSHRCKNAAAKVAKALKKKRSRAVRRSDDIAEYKKTGERDMI